MCFKSVCYIHCTTAVHVAFKFAVRDELSKDLVLKAVLHRVLNIQPVLYWTLTVVYLTQAGVEGEGLGTKGIRAEGTDNQGLQIC